MALLLDDLLDISRVTLGKLELRRQPIHLQDVVAAALQATRPLLEVHRHALHIDQPEHPVVVTADPLRLEQILVNLITNAAKYTEEGGRLELTVCERQNAAEVAVRDNGIGIAPADLDRVFQMFTQIGDAAIASSRSGTGLGIGLALAHGLAVLHGGELRVTSPGRGRGSCFTLTLPIGASDPQQPQPTFESQVPVTASRRVLIADDNRDIAETLAELLQLEGHQVCLAFTGLEALERYRSFRPDIALLDIGMPGMRGEEVAKAIRALPDGGEVVLVAITGWGQEKDKASTAKAGFDSHLTKPVDIAAIFAIVAAAAPLSDTSPATGPTI